MKISSDVNTIFAYGDNLHPFHNKVCLYMAKKIRDNYVLLAKVKAHFIYTCKDYLTTCCNIIDQAIRDYRNKRSKSPSTTYKPSPLAISANIDSLIDKHIGIEQSKTMNFNVKAVRTFIAWLLSEYSIPELYANDESFANFREKYVEEAEERALEVLNKFLKFFHQFESMNIEQYNNYEEWLSKIKKSEKNIFKNKQDYEDVMLAAEFLSYNQEFGLLGFFSSDKNCCDSIRIVSKEFMQRIGFVHCIN